MLAIDAPVEDSSSTERSAIEPQNTAAGDGGLRVAYLLHTTSCGAVQSAKAGDGYRYGCTYMSATVPHQPSFQMFMHATSDVFNFQDLG
jgi:hypothetical protein